MVLELAGDRALNAPVPTVVRASQLVDQHAVRGVEQLDGEHPDHIEGLGDPQRDLLGSRACSSDNPGHGATTSVQIPLVWTVRTTGYTRPGPRVCGPPGRRVAGERHVLLHEPLDAGGCRPAPRRPPPDRRRPTPPRPSYPPRDTLSTTGQAFAPAKSATSSARVTTAHAGHGTPAALIAMRMCTMTRVHVAVAARTTARHGSRRNLFHRKNLLMI